MKKLVIQSCVLMLASSFSLTALAAAESIKMRVEDMVCAFCASSIEKKLKALPATSEIYINLEKRVVAITTKDGKAVSDDELKKIIVDAGYQLQSVERGKFTMADIKNQVKADRYKPGNETHQHDHKDGKHHGKH